MSGHLGTRRRASFVVETLEGRALLSVASAANLAHPPAQIHALLSLPGGIKTDPAGLAAVLNALKGGAGSEFATLIRREVPNYLSIISQFASGKRTEFSAPGMVAKIPGWQPQYTGQHYDHMTATLAGAIILPNKTLELAGVMRGPFDEAVSTELVFALDRGAGAKIGPYFASVPGIKADALVRIHVGPYGQNNSATLTDLTTGKTTTLAASAVQVQGAVARVFVPLASLPSQGLKNTAYKFAMWTQLTPGADLTTVGSFAPSKGMVAVGVLPKR